MSVCSPNCECGSYKGEGKPEKPKTELDILIDKNDALVAEIESLDMLIKGLRLRNPYSNKRLRIERVERLNLQKQKKIDLHKEFVKEIMAKAPLAQPV